MPWAIPLEAESGLCEIALIRHHLARTLPRCSPELHQEKPAETARVARRNFFRESQCVDSLTPLGSTGLEKALTDRWDPMIAVEAQSAKADVVPVVVANINPLCPSQTGGEIRACRSVTQKSFTRWSSISGRLFERRVLLSPTHSTSV